jgi:hypothetical protein
VFAPLGPEETCLGSAIAGLTGSAAGISVSNAELDCF